MNYALRLPTSLAEHIKEFSKKEGISINQFIVTAVAEKMASLSTEENILSNRARQGSRKHALSMLDRVSDQDPVKGDALP